VTWDQVLELAKQYGWVPVGAALLVWAFVKGTIRPAREFEAQKEDEKALRADYEKRLADMERDRDFWRDKAWELAEHWQRDLSTGEQAARVATRVIGRR
jgi:primosomal protein N''